MRVNVDETYLEEGAEIWWRRISPAERAVLIQALYECGHDAESEHEQVIQAMNSKDMPQEPQPVSDNPSMPQDAPPAANVIR